MDRVLKNCYDPPRAILYDPFDLSQRLSVILAIHGISYSLVSAGTPASHHDALPTMVPPPILMCRSSYIRLPSVFLQDGNLLAE